MANYFYLDDEKDKNEEIEQTVLEDLPSLNPYQENLDAFRRLKQSEISPAINEEIGQEVADLEDYEKTIMQEQPESEVPESAELSLDAAPAQPSVPSPTAAPAGQFQQLLDQRQKQLQMLAMLRGAQQIGQAFAGKHSGQFKPDYSGVEALERLAQLPVEGYSAAQKAKEADIKLKDAEEARDPSSKISRFMRIVAKQRGIPVEETMSAKDLEALLKLAGKQANMMYSTESVPGFMTKESHPVRWDRMSQKMIDSITGKPVEQDNIIRAPEGKFLPGRGMAGLGGDQPPETFVPSAEQEKVVKDEEKELNSRTKLYQTSISMAKQVLDELDRGGKFTPAVVRTKMPRMFGEVGNLNEYEQKVWSNSPEIWNALETWYKTRLDPNQTMTDRDVQELKNVIKTSIVTTEKLQNKHYNDSIKRMQMIGVPPQWSSEYFGAEYRLPSDLKEGEVRRKTDDGRIAIFDAKTKKFLRYEK